MSDHTPTPWITDGVYVRERIGKDGAHLIATLNPHVSDARRKADAELIVRAVNSHRELLMACEDLLEALACPELFMVGSLPGARRILKDAISKANGANHAQ